PPSFPPSLRSILKEGKAAGHAICGGHVSGMFGFFFTEGPVRCFADAAKSDTVRQTPSCPSSFLSLVRAFSEEGSPPTVHLYQPAFEQLLSLLVFCLPPWHILVAPSLLLGLGLRFPPSPPTFDLPAARPVDAGSLSDPKPSLTLPP
ncbi:glutamate 1-semialdehyde aminotransferase, partial [Nannochloropsis gaditana]